MISCQKPQTSMLSRINSLCKQREVRVWEQRGGGGMSSGSCMQGRVGCCKQGTGQQACPAGEIIAAVLAATAAPPPPTLGMARRRSPCLSAACVHQGFLPQSHLLAAAAPLVASFLLPTSSRTSIMLPCLRPAASTAGASCVASNAMHLCTPSLTVILIRFALVPSRGCSCWTSANRGSDTRAQTQVRRWCVAWHSTGVAGTPHRRGTGASRLTHQVLADRARRGMRRPQGPAPGRQ